MRLAKARELFPPGAQPSKCTLRTWVTRGVDGYRLKALKVGGHWLTRPSDVRRFQRIMAAMSEDLQETAV